MAVSLISSDCSRLSSSPAIEVQHAALEHEEAAVDPAALHLRLLLEHLDQSLSITTSPKREEGRTAVSVASLP